MNDYINLMGLKYEIYLALAFLFIPPLDFFARELRMPTNRVGKLVREILDSDSKYQEVKDGKESLVRTESTLDWWKSLKSEIE
jgi:hypothetical protein